MEHEFERQLRTLAIERRPEACLGCGFEHGCSVHGCAVIHAAAERLAAYEETRLEPEDMKKAFNEDATLKLTGQALGMSPDRLRELAQAYRLLGNTVYEPNKRGVISTYKVISVHFSGCSILVGWDLLDGIYSNLNGFEISALGKTVFLTREAAEAALKEREAEHDR